MADFELLAPGGHQELVDEVLDRLDTKADYDGYYAQLTAGAADNLTGRGDGVSASYLYRTTGGDADVADGTATVKSIHGRTVRWNQLAGDFGTYAYANSNVSSSVTDNVITVEKNNASSSWANVTYTLPDVTSGHVFLMKASFSGNTNGERVIAFLVDGSTAGTYTTEASGIIKLVTTASTNVCKLRFYACYSSATSYEPTPITYSNIQLIDLTQMFGAGNEPSTVAEFEAMFPEPYYPYDAGSLLSVQMEGIETVGFNQWDEEWEVGGYSNSNGQPWTTSDRIRTKNPILVLPSTAYYLRATPRGGGAHYIINVYYYDASDSYISYVAVNENNVATTPANARYMRFSLQPTYGTTYNHDICINLSWSGYRNGEYEPYWKSERTIPAATYFPNGMRSAGSVYDELTSDAAVTRVGELDLSTVEWKLNTGRGDNIAYFTLTNASTSHYTEWVINGFDYHGNLSTLTDNPLHYTPSASGSNINVNFSFPSALSSAADALAYVTQHGTKMHYELATHTTVEIDPPLNLTYRVSDFGTERIMVPVNEQSAPPTMQVVYGLNVVDTMRRLPTEYISHDSFTQFRIALATFLDATITESWDATDGRYEYTIMQNGE